MPYPSQYSEELAKSIIDAITAGNYITSAFEINDLSRQTYYNWKKRASKKEEPYLSFIRRCNRALAIAEGRLNMSVEKAAVTDWRAAAWKLERTRPDKYAEHKINHTAMQQDRERFLDRAEQELSPEAFSELLDFVAKENGFAEE